MVKQFLKKKSKRQSARHRYKVEKKVREHNKKKKREAKKNANSKRKRKDPGVPNSLPFKEEILKEAELRKQKLEEEREKQKQRRKKDREKAMNKRRNLEGLVKDAQKKTAEYERKRSAQVSQQGQFVGGKAVETSLKAYYKEFRKVTFLGTCVIITFENVTQQSKELVSQKIQVVDAADVVLEVLDARDPLGSRCQQMEDHIISSGTNKRLVLVLNKIDLVPRENVDAWLKHLRNEFPTVAFKASTQTQSDNLSQTKVPLSLASDDLLKSSRCVGAEILMKLLGNYCRNKDIKTAIRIGVVGFPNTGKSSIINSLKRAKACNVGAMPGVTKSMQEVQLDKHIKLLDSPGVVMVQNASDTSVILRNCVRLENLEDPVQPVDAILKRCPKQQIMLHYNIPDYKDTSGFLSLLARRLGKLKKGGVPDVDKAARNVLQDWTLGKITYYTHPPEQHTLPTHVSASFVKEMGKEFSLDDLVQEEEEKVLKGLERQSSKFMLVESLGPVKVVMTEEDIVEENLDDEDMSDDKEEEEEDENEDEMDMEGDESELKSVTVPVKANSRKSSRKSSVSSVSSSTKPKVSEEGKVRASVTQMNKDRKKAFKQMKKKRKRADKVAGDLSERMISAFSGGSGKTEDYDFSVMG